MSAPHPGGYLRRVVLPKYDMTITDVAKHLGVSRITLSLFVHEHRACSVEMAIRLSKAFGQPARFWMTMQMDYDLAVRNCNPGPHVKPLTWDRKSP